MKDPAAKLMRGLVEAFVLDSLHREPKHGYALMKELEDLFGDEPNRNRIYPLLSRLEDAGYVQGREDPDSSRGKTVYHLTDDGEGRLLEYKRMPGSFRQGVHRFWTAVEATGEDAGGEADDGSGAEASKEQGGGPDTAPQTTPDAAAARSGTDGGSTVQYGGLPERPMEVPGAAAEDPPDPPYPCPDARVNLRKDPRTGEVEIELEGCPMGRYEYCPRCPVYKGVEGLRRLLFG